LQIINLGGKEGLGICAIPNEVFAITGLNLKDHRATKFLFVIELANGAEGYIPPPAQHDLGGYTTWPARTAALEVQAEPKITKAILRSWTDSTGVPRFSTDWSNRFSWKVEDSKPLAIWAFDEWEGPPALIRGDWFGKGPSGEYEAGVAYRMAAPPKFDGFSVQFVGGRMKADLKDLGPTYTAEFFFWNGFPSNVRPVTGYMFSRGVDGDKQAAGDHLGIGGTAGHAGKLIFFNGNDKNQVLAGKTDLKLKEWYHVALVRDGKKVTVYLNGKEEIAGEAENTVPEKSLIFFGGRCDKFAGFEGKIDEAAIFNRALSAEEIAKHFAAAN